MRIEQLYYFLETVRHGSINKASEQLHITQQSLNSALKNLEKEFDKPLLRRLSRGVELTEAGQVAAHFAEKILGELEDMHLDLLASQQSGQPEQTLTMKGTLILASAPALTYSITPVIIERFRQYCPNVSLKLTKKDNGPIIESLLKGDEGVGLITVKENEPLVDVNQHENILWWKKIHTANVCAVFNKAHPLCALERVDSRMLLAYPLAIFTIGDESENPLLKHIQKFGVPKVKLMTDNINVYCARIYANQAIGFAVKFNNNQNKRYYDFTYLPISDYPRVDVYGVVHQLYYQKNKRIIDALFETMIQTVQG